jgi:hypothetical protein
MSRITTITLIITFLISFTTHAYGVPVYVSKDLRVYHHDRNCAKLNTDDLIEFASPEKAREAGGIPCEHCAPPAVKETLSAPSYQPIDLKNRGVETQEKENENKETNHIDTNSDKSDLILGCWKDEDSMMEYFKDGTFVSHADTGQKYEGTWSIEGNILRLQFINPAIELHMFTIIEMTDSTYKIKLNHADKHTYNARRIEKNSQQEEASKLLSEFTSKNSVKAWPSIDRLYANPFVYEDKTIAIVAFFDAMESATSGIFMVFTGQWSNPKPIFVSSIPKNMFMVSGTLVVLAGKVLGKTETSLSIFGLQVPHLKFVDAHLCKDNKCSDIIPDYDD